MGPRVLLASPGVGGCEPSFLRAGAPASRGSFGLWLFTRLGLVLVIWKTDRVSGHQDF